MAVFQGSVFSKSMWMMTSVTVSLPEDRESNAEMPVIYLLHGLSDNNSAWLRRTNIDSYVEQYNFAVVMPEVQRSFYHDMAYGPKYFTYISEELPKLCHNMFHISNRREDNFVAGLSMGGYGALKTALRYPERFAAAASFSGAVNIHSRLLSETASISHEECIGINDGVIKPEDDLFHLASELSGRDCPKLFISCGLSDFLYDDNQKFREHLTKCGLPFVYEEWPGDHDWIFWDKSIQLALEFFAKTRNNS
jgi:S-formylglutathione hydrolase FrmB